MYLDGQMIFELDWVETTIAEHISVDTIDCGIANPNLGVGTPLWVNVVVAVQFESGGADTNVFTMYDEVDDGSGAPDGGSWAILLQTEAYLKAACFPGAPVLVVPLPAFHRRHLKVSWTIATQALTAGTINAYISLHSAPRR